MKILFLTLNYAPESIGIAPYSTGTAQELARQGHEVTVVAGKPYYPEWSVPSHWQGGLYRRSCENGVAIIRCAHYVPPAPSGMKRLMHHLSFALSATWPMLRAVLSKRSRPDIVLATAPSLLAVPVALLAARLCDARTWVHVQDFEVEAAAATGLLKSGSRGLRIAAWFERAILRSADIVSSISAAMLRRLAVKGVVESRIVEFRNWADINDIAPLTRRSPFRDEWRIDAPHVALYSGNIANKQGIEIVVEAARILHHRRDVHFVICGNGPNRAQLETLAAGLDNITFADLQPRDRLNELLGLASVHLLPQIAGAADLVLPSKLGNMLASGRPVVATAADGTGLASEVAGCGVVSPPGDAGKFAAAIERLVDDPETCAHLGTAARSKAEKDWSKLAILERLEKRITRLANREDHSAARIS